MRIFFSKKEKKNLPNVSSDPEIRLSVNISLCHLSIGNFRKSSDNATSYDNFRRSNDGGRRLSKIQYRTNQRPNASSNILIEKLLQFDERIIMLVIWLREYFFQRLIFKNKEIIFVLRDREKLLISLARCISIIRYQPIVLGRALSTKTDGEIQS